MTALAETPLFLNQPQGIPIWALEKVIPEYEMLITDANPFTLSRLNPVHKLLAQSTEQVLYSPHPLEHVQIADIGFATGFHIKTTLNVFCRAGIPADIYAVDINAAELYEARQRPELQPYYDETNPVRIHLIHEDGRNLATLGDASCDEARLIGVLDGMVRGNPASLTREIHRVLKPGGMAKVSFRSPYLDRLKSALEQAGDHIVWNGGSDIVKLLQAKKSPLQRGHAISRKGLTEILVNLGFSRVSYYGQLPVQYTHRVFNHNGENAEVYSFVRPSGFNTLIYNGKHFLIPHADDCRLEKLYELDLAELRELKGKTSNGTFDRELDRMLGREEINPLEEHLYTQHMFWYAEIEK